MSANNIDEIVQQLIEIQLNKTNTNYILDRYAMDSIFEKVKISQKKPPLLEKKPPLLEKKPPLLEKKKPSEEKTNCPKGYIRDTHCETVFGEAKPCRDMKTKKHCKSTNLRFGETLMGYHRDKPYKIGQKLPDIVPTEAAEAAAAATAAEVAPLAEAAVAAPLAEASKPKVEEPKYIPTLQGSPSVLKLIGPVTAYQYTIKINNENREVLLLGDIHESLQSCSLPDDEWITKYKNGFIKNISQMNKIYTEETNSGTNITEIYNKLQPFHVKIKNFYKDYLEGIKFNRDGMFIFDYILLLSKGNTCLDFYDEMNPSSQLRNIVIENDRDIDKRIYYKNILHNFLMFCGKTIIDDNYGLGDFIKHGSYPEWCKTTYKALRYHQSDVRKIPMKHTYNFVWIDETVNFEPPINKERFTTILNKYITHLITDKEFNYSDIFSDIRHYKSSTVGGTTTKVDISDKIKDTYLAQYNLIKKQYKKSVFVDKSKEEDVIGIITKVIDENTEDLFTYHEIQTRIMDFYLLFRLFIKKWEDNKTDRLSDICKINSKYPKNNICYFGQNHIKHIKAYISELFVNNIENEYESIDSTTCCNGLASTNTSTESMATNIIKKQSTLSQPKRCVQIKISAPATVTSELKIEIDNFTFRLDYICLLAERPIILLESTNKTNQNTQKFAIYGSLSELGALRLLIQGVGKYNKLDLHHDYVTATFIHMNLQKFIRDKWDNITKLTQSELNKKKKQYFMTQKKIRSNLSKLSYNVNKGSGRTRKNCLENSCSTNGSDGSDGSESLYKKISTLCEGIGSKCGRGKWFKLTSDIKKTINTFIRENELDLKIDSSIIPYIFVIKLIYTFLNKYYKTTGQSTVEEYIYDTKSKENTIINVTVYKVEIEEKENNSKKYNYYYIKYKIISTKSTRFVVTYQNTDYFAPLFIIPQCSEVYKYGIYDCYLPGCFYFCKPFEYDFQTSNKVPNVSTRTIGNNLLGGNYIFMGDLIDPYTFAAVSPAAALAASGGSKKKRTVTIKSEPMPKTVKGLQTRKKLLKKRIKKAEKKVKLSKNRIIRLK